MKLKIATILLLTACFSHALYAQKPTQGQVIGDRVPLYGGSTGNSSADSTRLPIMFKLKILGLKPGASYKYYTRFISLADTADTATTGSGIPIVLKKTGFWRSIASPDLNTSGGTIHLACLRVLVSIQHGLVHITPTTAVLHRVILCTRLWCIRKLIHCLPM